MRRCIAGQREHFAVSCLEETAHIFATNFETATGDTGDYIVIPASIIS